MPWPTVAGLAVSMALVVSHAAGGPDPLLDSRPDDEPTPMPSSQQQKSMSALPNEELIRAACPEQVRDCEENANCFAQFQVTLAKPQPGPLHDGVTAIMKCFREHFAQNARPPSMSPPNDGQKPSGTDAENLQTQHFAAVLRTAKKVCSQQLTECIDKEGCIAELELTFKRHTDSSERKAEIVSLIDCMMKKSPGTMHQNDRRQGMVTGAQRACRETFDACRAAQGCLEQLSVAMEAAELPSTGSPTLMGVLKCVREGHTIVPSKLRPPAPQPSQSGEGKTAYTVAEAKELAAKKQKMKTKHNTMSSAKERIAGILNRHAKREKEL